MKYLIYLISILTMPAVFGQSNIRGTWICEELAAPLIEGTTFTLLDLRDDSSKE